MNKMKVFLGGVVIVSLVVVLILFLDLGADRDPAKIANPDTLVIGTLGSPRTLDPIHSLETVGGEVILNVYENLVRYDGADLNTFLPMLSTDVPSSSNGLVEETDSGSRVRFPIRSDVLFHNGQPLLPEDVAYSFRRAMIHSHPSSPTGSVLESLLDIPDLGVLADQVGDQRACEIVLDTVYTDGDHVVFELKRTLKGFLRTIAFGNSIGAIMNKDDVIAHGGWDGDCQTWRDFYHRDIASGLPLHDRMMGTGPFKFERWTVGSELVLTRNDNYWRTPTKLRSVVYEEVPEFSTRKLKFEAGELDMINVNTQLSKNMIGTPGARSISNLPSLGSYFSLFNFNINILDNPYAGSGQLDGNGIPPDFFQDIHVRQAFTSLFDWKTYIEQVWFGEAHQANSIISASHDYYSESTPYFEFDLGYAEEQLKLAFNGELWQAGFKFIIPYNEGNDSRRLIAQMLKERIEEINPKFVVELQSHTWPTYLDHFLAKKIPMTTLFYQISSPNPYRMFEATLCENGDMASSTRIYEYLDLCDRVVEANSTSDEATRSRLYKELQDQIHENSLALLLVNPIQRFWQRTWVDGWTFNPVYLGEGKYLYGVSKSLDAAIDRQILDQIPDIIIEQW